jgi:hypothetical protein
MDCRVKPGNDGLREPTSTAGNAAAFQLVITGRSSAETRCALLPGHDGYISLISAPGLGADDVAEQFPFAALELHHLELFDWGKVGG